MIIYPAIDLRGGKVVRLKEGDPSQQTIFSDNPVETASTWQAQGAEWIHMVNLDGAFAEANDNGAILKAASALGVKIQFGGGLRSLADIGKALEQGASRVVLGTIAIQQPEIIEQAIDQWGAEAICIALDARDGQITTHGWQSATEWTPITFGQHIAAKGARHALYTDVRRDGLLIGADVNGTIAIGEQTGLQVIASGGVQGLAEIRELAQSGAVAGAIIGMALYTGQITLPAALEAAGA